MSNESNAQEFNNNMKKCLTALSKSDFVPLKDIRVKVAFGDGGPRYVLMNKGSDVRDLGMREVYKGPYPVMMAGPKINNFCSAILNKIKEQCKSIDVHVRIFLDTTGNTSLYSYWNGKPYEKINAEKLISLASI